MPHLAFYMLVDPVCSVQTDRYDRFKVDSTGLMGPEIEVDWTDMFHVFQTDRIELENVVLSESIDSWFGLDRVCSSLV